MKFIILMPLILTGCLGSAQKIETLPVAIKNHIQIQAKPRKVSMKSVKFYVVTADNLDEFISKFKKENGQLVFVGVSVKGYENLSLNVTDLERYIKQQKQIIAFYEESIVK